ncbi:MAG: N-acetyltransferase [Anaerolineae bacterium]|nr:N-acetyltransferase [Anaerolineae bacterium]
MDVRNNPAENRFEVVLKGDVAVVEYMIAGTNIIFTHTEVPRAFEGMGVGSKMAYVALEYAKAEGYKVQALCPFIAAFVGKHPEYQSITWGYEST